MGLSRGSELFSVGCYGVVTVFRVVLSRLLFGCQAVLSGF